MYQTVTIQATKQRKANKIIGSELADQQLMWTWYLRDFIGFPNLYKGPNNMRQNIDAAWCTSSERDQIFPYTFAQYSASRSDLFVFIKILLEDRLHEISDYGCLHPKVNNSNFCWASPTRADVIFS